MSTVDRLQAIIEPIVTELGLVLFDLDYAGGTVAVTIDRPPTEPTSAGDADQTVQADQTDHTDQEDHEGGRVDLPPGVDLGAITAVTKAVSRALDEHDPISGRYSLEVSSPGLERPLRTTQHFRWAVGQVVSIKTVPTYDGARRLKGTLVAASDDGVEIAVTDAPAEHLAVAYTDIDKARTVFEWGPAPKPGKPGRSDRSAGSGPSARSGSASAPSGKASRSGKNEIEQSTATGWKDEKKVSTS